MTGPSSRCTECSDTRTGQDSVTVRVLADLRSPVLLLDSWSVRVAAACPIEGRHPLLRTYGTNLPNSLTSVVPDRPWLSPPRTPVSDLGTDRVRLFTGSRLNRVSLSRRSPASCRYGFHEFLRFDRASARLGRPQSVGMIARGHWNINQFPICAARTATALRTG